MSTTKGNGRAVQWLREHAEYQRDDWCVIWPFSTTRGYGHFGYMGEMLYAHVYMCELAHGPAPSPLHQAAHSCGMGHEGCVNPKHLSWKTPSENQQDKKEHGTSMPKGRERYKLKAEDVAYIRSLAGQKTHDELARIFGVSRRNIGAILDGRSWGPEKKIYYYTDEEQQTIRGAIASGHNFTQIAKMVGRPIAAVQGWAYRQGLRSGQPCYRKLTPARGQTLRN
jgi:ribosomal protein S13